MKTRMIEAERARSDPYDTEDESAHKALRIKDAEIAQLKAELRKDAEVMIAMGITIERLRDEARRQQEGK